MLSNKGMRIFKMLVLNDRQAVTVKSLATVLEMSERTINNYLKEVSVFCEEHQIPYVSKRGLGIYLDLNNIDPKLLKDMLVQETSYYNAEYRIRYIKQILLSGWKNYSLTLFVEELYSSKAVINNDLTEVEKWLNKYEINLMRKPKKGIYIEGSELSKRTAIVDFNRKDYSYDKKDIKFHYDWRLSTEECSRMEMCYGKENLKNICEILKKFEENFDTGFTDCTYLMLVEYLCLQQKRISHECLISNEDIEELPEQLQVLSNKLSNMIEATTGNHLCEEERKYIGILISAAELQNTDNRIQCVTKIIGDNIIENVFSIIMDYLSDIMEVDFEIDEKIKYNLKNFLIHSLIRTKYKIHIINPFLDDIKKNYFDVFNSCVSFGNKLKKHVGYMPSEHEIAYLTLLIGDFMIRVEKHVNAIIVGAGGLFAANMMAMKIEQKVAEVHIVSVLSTHIMEQGNCIECDLIITTLPDYINNSGIPVVHITPLITEKDIVKIKRGCNNLYTCNCGLDKDFSLLNYIKPEFVVLDIDVSSKEELIEEECNLLENKGYVSIDYYKEVLHREAISSTEIGNGVAIPHGIENTVIKPAVVLIRLKNKMDWGNAPVDVIFLLALNFNDITLTRKFFKVFYDKVSDKEIMEQIRSAKAKEEILNALL